MSAAGLEADRPDTTRDAFLGGRVTLVQPRKGHRAGLDAAFLQALVGSGAEGHAVDFGCGVGTVAFCLAARAPGLTVIGVDRDPASAELARTALQLPQNAAFASRVRIATADVTDVRAVREPVILGDASVDWLLMNPPFDPKGRGTPSPDPGRRAAHVAESNTLPGWIASAAALLRPGGMLGMIDRPQALRALLAAIGGPFGDIRVQPLHPHAGEPASRVLIRARRGSGAALQLLSGIVLHAGSGAWTPVADAILRGEADLCG